MILRIELDRRNLKLHSVDFVTVSCTLWLLKENLLTKRGRVFASVGFEYRDFRKIDVVAFRDSDNASRGTMRRVSSRSGIVPPFCCTVTCL